jgi:YhgE/Pip-like protein
MAPPEKTASAGNVRAAQLLRARNVWAAPLIVMSVLGILMTAIYLGAIIDPAGNLRGLPVLVVDQDTGAATAKGRVDLGQEVVRALTRTPAVSDRLGITVTGLPAAEAQMNTGSAYVTVLIPRGFTASVLALARAPDRGPLPRVDLLANDRAGTLGVSLAEGVLEPALAAVSRAIGHHLQPVAAPGSAPAALLAAPVTVTPVVYRPLPSHSGGGLTAFYVALLVTIGGFLGGVIVNSIVDAALGYATSEVGPWWRERLPRPITRWQTLLAKWVVAVPGTLLFTGLLIAIAAGAYGMDAPYWFELWMYCWFAAAVIAIGTLALFAALGTLGQVIGILLFVYLALASSGGTVPIQALPGFYRFAANFEPLRQILGATRAILYFNAAGDAGLDRGLVLTAIGLAFWLVVGVAVTRWYDRKGLDRIPPEMLRYAEASARGYKHEAGAAGAGAPRPGDHADRPGTT